MLHDLVSFNTGHASPSSVGSSDTVRLRDCFPPSHSLVHWVQSPHAVTAQFTVGGHCWVLHCRCSLNCPQDAPPYCSSSRTERERCWCPDPHGTVHWLQSFHSLIVQFTAGQGAVLHSLLSSKAAQLAPPGDAGLMICLS